MAIFQVYRLAGGLWKVSKKTFGDCYSSISHKQAKYHLTNSAKSMKAYSDNNNKAALS